MAAQNVDVLLPNGGTMNYRLRAVYEGPLIAPVEKGPRGRNQGAGAG
ncbi:hypothetical protein V6L77_23850 [Pannonibacter sp. Pt2-lr]